MKTFLKTFAGAALALSAFGCTTSGGPGGGGSTPVVKPGPNETGNWEIQVTPTSGGTLFNKLSGFINEESGSSSSLSTTGAFQAGGATGCYLESQVVPTRGFTEGTQIKLTSFSVNGQLLNLVGNLNSTATQFTGTYVVSGGCANGAAGTIAGQLYQNLTGTYTGTIDGTSPAQTIQLNLGQYKQGNGDGVFFETGSASFGGFACFTSGNITGNQAYVLGSSVQLTYTTSGGTVVIQGTFDPAADTIHATSINVTDGSCSGSYGTATLALSK